MPELVKDNRFLALLRGINVSGRNKIPMSDLRALCETLGWRHVRTYIQSGNVVFRADAPAPELEDQLEKALRERFDLALTVIIRPAREWLGYLSGNPFPDASAREASRVMLVTPKDPPDAGAAAALQERAANQERVMLHGNVLWIHFPEGAGRSKLSPALLARLVGSPVTSRNWRSAQKLAEMLEALPEP